MEFIINSKKCIINADDTNDLRKLYTLLFDINEYITKNEMVVYIDYEFKDKVLDRITNICIETYLKNRDLFTRIRSLIDRCLLFDEIDDLKHGNIEDIYVFDDVSINGGQLSFLEFAYENNLILLSLSDKQEKVFEIIKKNNIPKEIRSIETVFELLILLSLKNDKYLELFFKRHNFKCSDKMIFDGWNELEDDMALKVLRTFNKEAQDLSNRRWDRLGKSRIEKLPELNDKLYEYRINLPSNCIFRIYFIYKEDVFIVRGLLKKSMKISNDMKGKILSSIPKE